MLVPICNNEQSTIAPTEQWILVEIKVVMWQPLVIGQTLWETLPSKCGLHRRDLIWRYPIISHVPPELLAEPKKSQWIAYSSDCPTMENLQKLMEFTSFHYQVNSKFDLHVYIFIFAYKIFSTENLWDQLTSQEMSGNSVMAACLRCETKGEEGQGSQLWCVIVMQPQGIWWSCLGRCWQPSFLGMKPQTPGTSSWDIIQHCRPWHGTPGQEAKDATRTWGTML